MHADLRRALQQASLQDGPVSADCRLTDADGTTRSFRLQVVPISEPETKAKCLLVLFHEAEEPGPLAEPLTSADPDSRLDARMQELERELLVTKEYLQTTIEELESANEELKSSNEELQSSNEELQSTNEELETSKEELQSANEELTTVNGELSVRVADHQQTLDDLHNVLGGVGSAVIIVGTDLRVRRLTQEAERVFNLAQTDVGRPVSQLNDFFDGTRVEQLCAEVIESLTHVNRELLGADQRWYALHIAPYRTLDQSITGAVVVFTDIYLRKPVLELGHGSR